LLLRADAPSQHPQGVILRVVVLGHGETMMLKFASSVASNSVLDVLSCSDSLWRPLGQSTAARQDAARLARLLQAAPAARLR
jgi:hypothetical protein